MLHLRKEVGISDVKKILVPVRFYHVSGQNPLDSGTAGRYAYFIRILVQKLFGAPKRPPSMTGRKHGCLTVEGDDAFFIFAGVNPIMPAFQLEAVRSAVLSLNPAGNSVGMDMEQCRYFSLLAAGLAQYEDAETRRFPTAQPLKIPESKLKCCLLN